MLGGQLVFELEALDPKIYRVRGESQVRTQVDRHKVGLGNIGLRV